MEVTRSLVCWKPGQQKQTWQKTQAAQSDSRRPPVKLGGPHPYGCKDIWLTKSYFLYHLFFLVSTNTCEQVIGNGCNLGTLAGATARVCVPKALLTAAPTQAGEGSSVLNLFVPRIRPVKTVRTSQGFSRFSGRL